MKTYDMQPIIDFFTEQQEKLNSIMQEIEEKPTKIIYPTLDDVAKWTFILPLNSTRFDCYEAGIKDCINYIKRVNE